jgi:thiazole synthase
MQTQSPEAELPFVDQPLVLGQRQFRSRLIVGTGKYRDFAETRAAVEASGAEIVTVAIRRTNLGQNPDEPNLLDFLPPERFTILPNTACARSAWRVSSWTGTTWSNSKCSATPTPSSPT